MISYEGASEDSVDCYLAEKLAPLQPIILWGRTANIDPVVDKSHAVYYWWLDFPLLKKGLSFYHHLSVWVSAFRSPFGIRSFYSLLDVCGSGITQS